MSELLPCPFCGGDPTLIVGSVAFNDYEVQCDTCGFSGPNFGALDQEPFPREDAVRHWNTRTDVSDALVAAAREDALREAMVVADAAMKKYAAATYSKEPVKVFNAGDDQPSQSAAKCYCAGEIYQEIEALIEKDQ